MTVGQDALTVNAEKHVNTSIYADTQYGVNRTVCMHAVHDYIHFGVYITLKGEPHQAVTGTHFCCLYLYCDLIHKVTTQSS